LISINWSNVLIFIDESGPHILMKINGFPDLASNLEALMKINESKLGHIDQNQ